MITALRSALFSAGFLGSILVFSPFTIVGHLLPMPARLRIAAAWAGFNRWWFATSLGVRYVIEGAENIPDRDGGIVLANHQSTWETFALFRLFPRQCWVLKRELLRIPVFGWGLALVRPVAIDRGAGRRAMSAVIEQGGKRLGEGRWLVIFPEGTRVPPGERARFKTGGALLATRTGEPVIPVAHDAGRIWPKGRFLKPSGTIHVVIGEPIPTEGRSAESVTREVEDWIRARLAEMDG